MSKNLKKRDAYRERRNKRQEQQAKSVIRWICVTLAILAVGLFGYFAVIGS